MRLRPSQSLLKSFWDRSQTKFWALVQILGSGVLASITEINSYLSNPEFKSYLDVIDVPKSVIILIATLGLLTYIFHGHNDA